MKRKEIERQIEKLETKSKEEIETGAIEQMLYENSMKAIRERLELTKREEELAVSCLTVACLSVLVAMPPEIGASMMLLVDKALFPDLDRDRKREIMHVISEASEERKDILKEILTSLRHHN